jgi:DNA-binding HxlR family transcriptional regulator
MKILVLHSEAEFQELKRELKLTDGNLASHLRALESVGYVGFRKEIEGRRVKTYYYITKEGLDAFNALKDRMKEVFSNG